MSPSHTIEVELSALAHDRRVTHLHEPEHPVVATLTQGDLVSLLDIGGDRYPGTVEAIDMPGGSRVARVRFTKAH